jgi:hydroxymethylpyrimidine/phosphomethylpyrimidine kinase
MLFMDKVPVVLTIAGSDSCGGAGIEADLKVFAALNVHGVVAVTAITAQNTFSVSGIFSVPADFVGRQIDAVVEDFGVNAAKTGMLYSQEIVSIVSSRVRRYGFPVVVDPVMISKSGSQLLKEDAVKSMVRELLPLTTVLTPNIPEAEVLSGLKIRSINDMVKAAEIIREYGVKAVVVKGGHLKDKESPDVLVYEGGVEVLSSPRIESKTTHGTGCIFSAAIAAEIAKGSNIVDSVRRAKELTVLAVRYGLNIGKGYGPVNPMVMLYRESSRYQVIRDVEESLKLLKHIRNLEYFIPEVGMNIAMAIPYATSINDVAAVPGRIVKSIDGVKIPECVKFGASSHLARYILKIMDYNANLRSALNIKYSSETLKALKGLGLKISSYDRRLEPEEIKSIEGATIPWGVEQAVSKCGFVPDVIYHTGDIGKEPMIVVFAENARKAVEILARVSDELKT